MDEPVHRVTIQFIVTVAGAAAVQMTLRAVLPGAATLVVLAPLAIMTAGFWWTTRRFIAVSAEVARLQADRERMAAEREQYAAERERQLSQFDAAMHSVPIAMTVIDPELRYVRVNEACAQMTGHPVEDHAGRTLREVNPRLEPTIEAAIREALRTGEPCLNLRVSRRTPHAKSGIIELIFHVTPFRDAQGRIAGVCSTATDVTEWKVLQEQFFQAQKLETVGQLAASIAHDFNNLLTVIGSYCDLVLLELPESSPYRGEIEEIRRAAQSATTLAQRMLGAARSKTVVIRPIDFTAAVEETRHLLAHATRGKAALDVTLAVDPSVVIADPTQVEQVLMNLVINAVDAMPDGGTISVRTANVALDRETPTIVGPIAAGAYAELTVADSGTGMDAETLGHIFEPFFTTKPRGKGTGLGLATVFGIVRELGGGLTVDSAVGQGTTFRVLLPRASDEESTVPRRARAAAAAKLPTGTETVLIVEDEDALRHSIAHLFSRQGYRVLEARHAGEALRIAEHEAEIALVMSDLHMPGIGGRELSARMHALGRRVPVLFMNDASGAEDNPGDAWTPDTTTKYDRFIAKPFEPETLLRTAREMLEPV